MSKNSYVLPECQDSVRQWDRLFSNETLCRVYSGSDGHKRASGVPCLYRAITNRELMEHVHELRMSPSALIGHLKSIGWYGRLEFVDRLSVAYNTKLIESGG